MVWHILQRCFLSAALILRAVADGVEDQRFCRPRRIVDHLIGVLPPKVDSKRMAGLERFRKLLERDTRDSNATAGSFLVCSQKDFANDGLISLDGETSSSRGRRLQSSVTPEIEELQNQWLAASAVSMDFIYRQGPIVQAFAGMGVTGPSVDGGNPNYTFLGAPVTISFNEMNGNMLLGDEIQHKVQELVDMNPGWNTTTLVDGTAWRKITDAGRLIEVTMRTPSSVTYDGADVYFTDYDNGRIFVRSAQYGGNISVVANLYGRSGVSGDCAPSTLARLRMPLGLTIIPAYKTFPKRLAFSDSGNNRVRTIELTDWPFCVDTTLDCSSYPGNGGANDPAIDLETGRPCTSGDCSFNTSSPDECAFRCNQLGVTSYPFPNPFRDLLLSSADIVELMKGCDSSDGSADAYLLACLSGKTADQTKALNAEAAVPFYVRTYSLVKPFATNMIATDEKIQGAVVQGRLLRLNSSQLGSSNWAGSNGHFRISKEHPLPCVRWGWTQTSTQNDTVLERFGTCILFHSDVTCSGAVAGGVSMSASKTCAPGKISTLIGGGNPGLPAEPSPSGQTLVSHPLAVRLAKPQNLLIMNGGLHGEMLQPDIPAMTLVISDTGHNRILGYPLATHRNFKVRFWLFMSGPQAAFTSETMWKIHGYGNWVVYWALGQSIGWQHDFDVVKVSDLILNQQYTPAKAGRGGLIPPLPENIAESCDPTLTPTADADRTAEFAELGKTVCSVKVCPSYQANGFPSQACCTAFCEQTYATCGLKIALWPAGLSSIQKCNALSEIQSCFVNISVASSSTCASGVSLGTVDTQHFLKDILALPDDYDVNGILTGVCAQVIAGTVNATGCDGWCDLKIAEVLGIHGAPDYRGHWHTDGNDTETIYAALIEISTFSNQQWHEFGKSLNEMKVDELRAQNSSNNNYTMDINNPTLKFGVGRRALLQMTLDYGLQQYYGFPPDSVRVSLSAPSWYNSFNTNDFMTEGTDRNNLVYWLSGFSGHAGNAHGGVTSYHHPTGLAIDKAQRLYIADSNNYRVLRMQNLWTNEYTVPIIGTGYKAFNGDGEYATQTALMYPRGLTIDNVGVLHFSDPHTHSIRQHLGENWNLPCGYSSYYWKLLTDPSATDFAKISEEMSCRMSQVKATLLYNIECCQSWWLGRPSSITLENQTINITCNTDHDDAKKSLCAPSPWYRRPLADQLTVMIEEPPECSGCLNQCGSPKDCRNKWGCQHPTANLTWNATDDAVNQTYQMTFWLSDAAIQQGMDALNALIADNQASLDWSNIGQPNTLAKLLNEAKNTVGVAAMESVVDQLKVLFEQRTSSTPMKMAFYKMWHWYQNIVDVCTRVVDSKDVDGRAIIGAQYYDKMSEIASRTFWSSLNLTEGSWLPSSAYPKCNFQHPRMFGYEPWMIFPFDNRDAQIESTFRLGPARMLHLESIKYRCCNVNSYICGEGEGPCSINIDCGAGLVCGYRNCLWSEMENCCMKVDASHAFAKVETFANKVGYRNLMVDR